MYTLLTFIAYFAIALLCGVILAYPAQLLLNNWFELDFVRVASRTVLITATVLFFVLYKSLRFSSWQELGFTTNKKQFFSDILKGIAVGLLIMSPVIAGLLLTKNRVIDTDWEVSFLNIISLVATALVSGLVIALLEETLFRGAMLSAIRKQSSIIFALVVTSIIYALIHFIEPNSEIASNELQWTSGLHLLKDAFLPFTQFTNIFDSFIALFLAGILLSLVRINTNRIALCMGIHAGWVIAIKVFKRVTDTNVNSDFAFLTGSYDKVIGYLAAICIALFIVGLLKYQNKLTS